MKATKKKRKPAVLYAIEMWDDWQTDRAAHHWTPCADGALTREQAREKLRVWKRNAAGHRLRIAVYRRVVR